MSYKPTSAVPVGRAESCVPGTSFPLGRGTAAPSRAHEATVRDPALRQLYLSAALAEIPRLLGAIDRNPYRPTYGCLDRQYWHYRTSSFPSEMYQEGVLALALVYATDLPGNRWYGNPRVRELAVAGIRFAARASHRDGSCDDYYPFERALGAAVFSLQAAARAYQLLKLDDPAIVQWFARRARWLARHDESGRLSNHQALAALGLARVAQITGDHACRHAAEARIDRLLAWQSREGWFEEYGGADPGYQTVTIDCLAKYRRMTGEARLDEPLRRGVQFARLFLHPDHSYGGHYGSRGTHHFYPHGMELLAAQDAAAADLADGFLQSLRLGSQAHFSDDRMFAHRLGNLIEAYLDWSPLRPAASRDLPPEPICHLPHASMLVRRTGPVHTVVSAARGGVFKHFAPGKPALSDAGLIVETSDGRLAVSQWHSTVGGGKRQAAGWRPEAQDAALGTGGSRPGPRTVRFHQTLQLPVSTPQPPASRLPPPPSSLLASLSVSGPLVWSRFETATPLKQALLLAGMWALGRFCRTLVRRLLQRRLITGWRACPIRLTRRFDLLAWRQAQGGCSLRIVDTIELMSPTIRVKRMAFGTDHESAYVAAGGVYQEGVLAPWLDLAGYVDQLNARRRVTIVREV